MASGDPAVKVDLALDNLSQCHGVKWREMLERLIVAEDDAILEKCRPLPSSGIVRIAP